MELSNSVTHTIDLDGGFKNRHELKWTFSGGLTREIRENKTTAKITMYTVYDLYFDLNTGCLPPKFSAVITVRTFPFLLFFFLWVIEWNHNCGVDLNLSVSFRTNAFWFCLFQSPSLSQWNRRSSHWVNRSSQLQLTTWSKCLSMGMITQSCIQKINLTISKCLKSKTVLILGFRRPF